jgi:hypothetical protein
MDRRLLNIASLKEQQKRCPNCKSELYAVIKDKGYFSTKLGKAQDLIFYHEHTENKTITPCSSWPSASLTKNTTYIYRYRVVIKKNKKLSTYRIKKFSKRFLKEPESQHIRLKCQACNYYCYVHERTSSIL